MKKNLSLLIFLALTLCLVSFAFDRVAPPAAAQAACVAGPVSSSAGGADGTPPALAPSVQPAVWIIAGLVCALFGLLALFPLLAEDSAHDLSKAGLAEK